MECNACGLTIGYADNTSHTIVENEQGELKVKLDNLLEIIATFLKHNKLAVNK